MANTTSARKATRSSLRKSVYNTRAMNKIRKAKKALRLSVSQNKDPQPALSELFSALGKAAKRNTIHKKKRDRLQSRANHLVARAKQT